MIIDITQQFLNKFNEFNQCNALEIKREKSEKSIVHKEDYRQKLPNQSQIAQNFVKTIYLSLCKIEEILQDKKDNYFSNAAYSLTSFTNQQRNQFDQTTKDALKTCSDQIDQLQAVCKSLSQNIKKSRKFNDQLNLAYAEHLKQAIICLHQYYKKLKSIFRQFLKFNELKKKKILNTLSLDTQARTYKQTQYFLKKRDLSDFSQVDMQNTDPDLQKEAHLFYIQKIQEQKKAIQAKQTIESISSILEVMGKKVLDQQLLTSSFEDIGSVGLQFIDEGNKNLLHANTLSKQMGRYWIILFMSLAFSLLFVDFLKS